MFVRNQSISLKVSLNSTPSSKYSDGSYPVVLQIIHKRKVYRKRLGFRSFPDQWDTERFVSNKQIISDYLIRNKELDNIETKAINILNKEFKDSFNYQSFSKLMDCNSSDALFLEFVIKTYIDELYSHDRAGTAMYYESVLRSVKNYKKNVLLEDVDRFWIKDYVKHYTHKSVKCIAYLRGLKAIFGYAIKEFDLEYSIMPFKTAYQPKGYDISEAKKIKVKKLPTLNGRLIKCLTDLELEQVKNYKPNNQGKQRAYDLFMFSYYSGGVNAKDIALMKYTDIRNGIWYYKREKTGLGGEGKPLSKNALRIISNYENQSEYVFPWILNGKVQTDKEIKRRLNSFMSNLKRRYYTISKECKLDGYFSFYTARITAATVLANKGANLKAVQTALDHSNLAMTSKYIRRIDNNLMVETFNLL